MRTWYLAVASVLLVAATGCSSEPETPAGAADATSDTRADDASITIDSSAVDTGALDTGALDVVIDEGAADATDTSLVDDGSSDAPVATDGSGDVIDAAACTLPPDGDAGGADAGTGYCVCVGTGCPAPAPCPAGNVCVVGVGCRRRTEACEGVPCGSIFCAGAPPPGFMGSLCWSDSRCVVDTSS